MEDWNPDYATVYRQLAKIAVPLSQQQGNTSAANLREILGSLNSD